MDYFGVIWKPTNSFLALVLPIRHLFLSPAVRLTSVASLSGSHRWDGVTLDSTNHPSPSYLSPNEGVFLRNICFIHYLTLPLFLDMGIIVILWGFIYLFLYYLFLYIEEPNASQLLIIDISSYTLSSSMISSYTFPLFTEYTAFPNLYILERHRSFYLFGVVLWLSGRIPSSPPKRFKTLWHLPFSHCCHPPRRQSRTVTESLTQLPAIFTTLVGASDHMHPGVPPMHQSICLACKPGSAINL